MSNDYSQNLTKGNIDLSRDQAGVQKPQFGENGAQDIQSSG